MITNSSSATNVHEVADGIYRINTPVSLPGDAGQFNFNQYLIVDDAPLLFHSDYAPGGRNCLQTEAADSKCVARLCS